MNLLLHIAIVSIVPIVPIVPIVSIVSIASIVLIASIFCLISIQIVINVPIHGLNLLSQIRIPHLINFWINFSSDLLIQAALIMISSPPCNLGSAVEW